MVVPTFEPPHDERSMDAARYARVKSLFLRAMELDVSERERMLAAACADDPQLRDEIESLLACAPEVQATAERGVPIVMGAPTDTDVTAVPTAAVGARRCPRCRVTFDSNVYFCLHDGEALVSNPDALVGTLFDEIYEIESLLGEGGMGTVYRARHQLLRDVVALKMLRGDERENVRWRRRFVREGQAARRFRHPNAVTVYDLRLARDGTIYLVLEFVQGITLRAALRERRHYDCEEVVHILEPLASVLDTAHRAGVVHRDLKPDNVMLSHGGSSVKLLDLGIAGILGSEDSQEETAQLTQAGTVIGTPRYMSPEQWGERQRDEVRGVDARADVYSLGVMVFELVTGRGPFRGNDAHDLRHSHCWEPPPDPRTFKAEIPETFALAILTAMAKDRSDRYGSAGEFVAALAESVGIRAPHALESSDYPGASGASAALTLIGGQTVSDAQVDTDVRPNLTVEDPPSNLPPSLTSFVGRHTDVEAVVDSLRHHRLVTLLGPGGIGKTRLAIQSAREAFDAFKDGVWFVDLSVLTHASLVLPSVGRMVDATDRPGERFEDAIVDAIGSRAMLLVLDNCEHVIGTVRPLIDELVRRCPNVSVLATSRELLGLGVEHVRDVPALTTPGADVLEADLLNAAESSEAVLLFVDRARAVRGDFRLTPENVVAVSALCRRLDGIPLAVELAAARTVVMSPAQILARLERNLDLLASRNPGIPDRHRTLRASIEWSYQLLSSRLQQALGQLSVFRGGWTLEAAERVLPAGTESDELIVVDALEQLAASSLIVAEEHSGNIRFRMLETIREFAGELFGTDAVSILRTAHAQFFREFVEAADALIAGANQPLGLSRVAADIDNLRAAMEWSRQSGDTDLELALTASMGRFWTMRGFVAEGLTSFRDILARARGSSPDRAKALHWAGNLATMAGDLDRGRAWHEEALGIRRTANDRAGIAASLHNLGGLAADQGDFELADRHFAECTSIATEMGDDLRLGMALINRGRAANERGRYVQAVDFLERGIDLLDQHGHLHGVCVGLLCLADARMCSGDLDRASLNFEKCSKIATEIGERTASGFAECGLGSVARYRGLSESAQTHCERAVAIARELGAEDLHATALAVLGEIAMAGGHLDEANRLLRQSLRIRSARNLRSGIASSLEGLAQASVAGGKYERAARFLGAASALRAQIGVPVPAIDAPAVDEASSIVERELGAEVFEAAYSMGSAVPLGDLRADVID